MKVVLGVLLAIVVAGVGNTLVSLLAQALGASADVVMGLQPQAYLFLTAVGVVLGAIGWWTIRRLAANPSSLLGKLVPVVVAVSLLADVPLFLVDGASPIGVVALMLMHVVVAAAAVPVFHRVLPVAQPRTASAR